MFAEGKNDIAHRLSSRNGMHWTDHGSLDICKTDGTPIGPGPYGTPTAWFENGTWYLFYERGDQGGWLATSRDLKTWTNVKDDPVLARGPDSYDATAVALIKSSSAGRITMPSTMPMPSGPGPTGRRMSPARATWCTGRYTQLDSGEKKDSDEPYQEPESTKSSRQRVHTAQACENTLRTGSAIPDNPGTREVIPSTSVGWAFVTKESPSP